MHDLWTHLLINHIIHYNAQYYFWIKNLSTEKMFFFVFFLLIKYLIVSCGFKKPVFSSPPCNTMVHHLPQLPYISQLWMVGSHVYCATKVSAAIRYVEHIKNFVAWGKVQLRPGAHSYTLLYVVGTSCWCNEYYLSCIGTRNTYPHEFKNYATRTTIVAWEFLCLSCYLILLIIICLECLNLLFQRHGQWFPICNTTAVVFSSTWTHSNRWYESNSIFLQRLLIYYIIARQIIIIIVKRL